MKKTALTLLTLCFCGAVGFEAFAHGDHGDHHHFNSIDDSKPELLITASHKANFKDKTMDLESITSTWMFPSESSSEMRDHYDANKNKKFDKEEVVEMFKDFEEVYRKNDYFTNIYVNSKRLKDLKAKKFNVKYVDGGNMNFIFDIVFEEPVNIYKKNVDVSVVSTSPEYFFVEGREPLTISIDGKPAKCTYSSYKEKPIKVGEKEVTPKVIKICKTK